MFKRKSKFKNLENNFKTVGNSLNRSWEWINHLNNVNSVYEERIIRVEKTNKQLVEVTRELIRRMQELEVGGVEVVEEVMEEAPMRAPRMSMVDEAVNLPKKDLFLIELLYHYAAFNRDSSIETGTLYDNLIFKITKRGLRKKLTSLVDNNVLRSVKRGNSRYWYLNPGSLAKIKSALKTKE